MSSKGITTLPATILMGCCVLLLIMPNATSHPFSSVIVDFYSYRYKIVDLAAYDVFLLRSIERKYGWTRNAALTVSQLLHNSANRMGRCHFGIITESTLVYAEQSIRYDRCFSICFCDIWHTLQ